MATEVDQVAALLKEASETHHTVYRIVDGDDPDWASWYTDWLLELSELPDELGTKPVRSQLVHSGPRASRMTTPRTWIRSDSRRVSATP